jgi:predicted cytidylate kinase
VFWANYMLTFRAITVSGEVGSGKSSVAEALMKVVNQWKYINVGQLFRQFCADRGMSIQQVGLVPDSIHVEFDEFQRQILRSERNVIVEGRLAGWLGRGLEDVYKVYCLAPFETRVERYMRREQCTKEKALTEIRNRDQHDVEKYKMLYGIDDYRSPSFYDLCIDTSIRTPAQLAAAIVTAMESTTQRHRSKTTH